MGAKLQPAYRFTDALPLTPSRDGQPRSFDDIPTGWEQSFIHAHCLLIDALHSGGPPGLTAVESRTILRPPLAAWMFARTGQSVPV